MNKFKVLLAILALMTCVKIGTYKSESYLRSRVVQLTGDKRGSCSGVQVHAPSGEDYILSAAHCSILADEYGNINVRLDDTRFIKRRIVELSKDTDLMLLEGMPNLKGLSIAKKYKIGQHVRSLTHGAGLDTYKTEGELIQVSIIEVLNNIIKTQEDELACSLPKNKIKTIETIFGEFKVCLISFEAFVSTAKVVPGSSGGAIIDDKGNLIGIVSAGDETFGIFVTNDAINEFLSAY